RRRDDDLEVPAGRQRDRLASEPEADAGGPADVEPEALADHELGVTREEGALEEHLPGRRAPTHLEVRPRTQPDEAQARRGRRRGLRDDGGRSACGDAEAGGDDDAPRLRGDPRESEQLIHVFY